LVKDATRIIDPRLSRKMSRVPGELFQAVEAHDRRVGLAYFEWIVIEALISQTLREYVGNAGVRVNVHLEIKAEKNTLHRFAGAVQSDRTKSTFLSSTGGAKRRDTADQSPVRGRRPLQGSPSEKPRAIAVFSNRLLVNYGIAMPHALSDAG
jgi:hypothetical protein